MKNYEYFEKYSDVAFNELDFFSIYEGIVKSKNHVEI